MTTHEKNGIFPVFEAQQEIKEMSRRAYEGTDILCIEL
jgi:hypothetical protein